MKIMDWYVYIVRCNDESFYTGICTNLKKREEDHNSKKYKRAFTKGRLPVKIVYWEKFTDKYGAARREKEIKGWGRFKKQKLIDSLLRTQ